LFPHSPLKSRMRISHREACSREAGQGTNFTIEIRNARCPCPSWTRLIQYTVSILFFMIDFNIGEISGYHGAILYCRTSQRRPLKFSVTISCKTTCSKWSFLFIFSFQNFILICLLFLNFYLSLFSDTPFFFVIDLYLHTFLFNYPFPAYFLSALLNSFHEIYLEIMR
jgi:hypothetical protein